MIEEKSNRELHREAFELFYSKETNRNRFDTLFERKGDGYLIGHTHRSWITWLSGARVQVTLENDFKHKTK